MRKRKSIGGDTVNGTDALNEHIKKNDEDYCEDPEAQDVAIRRTEETLMENLSTKN